MHENARLLSENTRLYAENAELLKEITIVKNNTCNQSHKHNSAKKEIENQMDSVVGVGQKKERIQGVAKSPSFYEQNGYSVSALNSDRSEKQQKQLQYLQDQLDMKNIEIEGMHKQMMQAM